MNQEELVKDPTYQKIVATIDKEVDYVDDKPYSHNIISLALQHAHQEFGHEVANDLIDVFELEKLGWRKLHPEDDI